MKTKSILERSDVFHPLDFLVWPSADTTNFLQAAAEIR